MATRREFTEVTYTCKCGHKQTVRYFLEEPTYPAVCCVVCREGLGNTMSYGEMAMRGIGMQAGKPVHV